MDGQYWRPNHVNKRVVADIWLLTVSWTLTWEMMRIRNFYCFVYRQHIWLRKWEVIVGDMIDHVGIYGSRVAEGLSAFNVGLVSCASKMIIMCTLNWLESAYDPFVNIRRKLFSSGVQYRCIFHDHTPQSSVLIRVLLVSPVNYLFFWFCSVFLCLICYSMLCWAMLHSAQTSSV